MLVCGIERTASTCTCSLGAVRPCWVLSKSVGEEKRMPFLSWPLFVMGGEEDELGEMGYSKPPVVMIEDFLPMLAAIAHFSSYLICGT